MGTLTKLELQDEVRAGLGGRTDLDLRLGRFLNLAQHRLARRHDFDEMQIISSTQIFNTGSDNDRFLSLPTIREVYSIVLLDGASSKKLERITAQRMDRMQSMPEYFARNRPAQYTLWGNTIEMFPMTDATYTIRMRWTQWPLNFTLDTDVSQFRQKDDVLIEMALSYANYSLGKESEALKHEARAKMLLDEAEEVDRTNPDLNIMPGQSDGQVAGTSTGAEPWNDPFIRSTNQ